MRYMTIGLAALLLAGCGNGTGPEPERQTWTRTFHIFGTVRSAADSVPIPGADVAAVRTFFPSPYHADTILARGTTDRNGDYSLPVFTRAYRTDTFEGVKYCGGLLAGDVDFDMKVAPHDGVHLPGYVFLQFGDVVCGRRENRIDIYVPTFPDARIRSR
jgi:hypothetical protein